MENPVTTLSKWDSGVWSRRNIPLSLGICFFAICEMNPRGAEWPAQCLHTWLLRGSLNSDYGVVFWPFPMDKLKALQRPGPGGEEERRWGVPEPEAEVSHSQNLGWTPCGRWGHSYPACGTVFPWSRLNPFCFLWIFFLFLFFSTNSVQCTVFW